MRGAIDVHDLHFSYSDAPILNGLTLSVDRGEMVGVLGPNGSGKTTFLKNLIRYLRPDRGSVSFWIPDEGAKPVEQMSSKQLSRLVGLVPQRSGGGESLTVFEMVLLGRLPHIESRWSGYSEDDREAVECMLEGMGILAFRNRLCQTLSGGEFQKVLLARALVQDTDIIVLDEATANLDMHHAVEIMDLVRSLVGEGRTVVAVMHDLNLAAAYCDRTVFMRDGLVRFVGPPREVFTPEVIRNIFGVDLYLDVDDDGVPFVLPRSRTLQIARRRAE
jgi:iron complex transport system ATP-binding protein